MYDCFRTTFVSSRTLEDSAILDKSCNGPSLGRTPETGVDVWIRRDTMDGARLPTAQPHGSHTTAVATPKEIAGGRKSRAADGKVITIDGQGHIHVAPPEGPGDPEIRQAVER
jgi:hypothetical protein